ncbi:MAG TPA: sensory rhodopsin transducer, partial [Mariniphaga sp.]|nr:sensory rhodopsin transducer [Mariniphaga sp.]
MSIKLGHKIWAIPEGYIPGKSNGPAPEFTSHETACILNAGDKDADIEITIYFTDRDPVGPYKVKVPAKRTLHLRFNELNDPQEIPRD